MRETFHPQRQLGSIPIHEVDFDLQSRHEIVPILMGLQHIYSNPTLRDEIMNLIAQDILRGKRDDHGAMGMKYWDILVLAAVRLGCDLDFDALVDLANNHKKLRQMMEAKEWPAPFLYTRSTVHGNLTKLSDSTLKKISDLVVGEGHSQKPKAIEKVRGDTFVVETNIHYPTDANLIIDGLRKILTLTHELAKTVEIVGWRQHDHHLRKAKRLHRKIQKIARSRRKDRDAVIQELYTQLLQLTRKLIERVLETLQTIEMLSPYLDFHTSLIVKAYIAELFPFLIGTTHMCDLAERRILKGEDIAATEKLYSMFEPHTELINRGKMPTPIEFGHRVLVLEDSAGFIVDWSILHSGITEEKIIVKVMSELQERMSNKIKVVSFDKGFYTPENVRKLSKIVELACLPKKGKLNGAHREREMAPAFQAARKRHPGIESAIHAVVADNGLGRCRDKGERGYHRYVALAMLGRNLHTLGTILLKKAQRKEARLPKAA